MLELKTMPHENTEQWASADQALTQTLPKEIIENISTNGLTPTVVRYPTGIAKAINILNILLYLMLLENNKSGIFIATQSSRNSYSNLIHLLHIFNMPDNNNFLVMKANIDTQNVIRNNINDIKRLTAFEKLIQKGDENVMVFKKDHSFVMITDKKFQPKSMYQAMYLYASIIAEEHDIKMSEPVEKYLKALINEDRYAFEPIVLRINKNPIVKKAEFKRYQSIFTPQINNLSTKYENDIKTAMEKLKDLERQYTLYLRKYDEANALYEDARMKSISIDIEKIIKHIETCPYIEDYQALNEDTIELHYYCPIISYDPFLADKKKFGSTESQVESLTIFSDYGDTYELWTDCVVQLTPKYNEVERGRKKIPHRLGHPHLEYYGCKGSHIRYIIQDLKEANYEKAINQISEMTMELNFKDGTVIHNMLKLMDTDFQTQRIWRNKITDKFLTKAEVLEEIKNGKTETNN